MEIDVKMNSYDKVITKDSRSGIRIKENSPVAWYLKDQDTRGEGKIRNISTTGMLLETNSNFQPFDNCLFSFDSDPNKDDFIPRHGRLVWFKKKDFATNKYLCGVQFVDPAEDVLSKLRERIQTGVTRFTHTRKWQRVGRFLSWSAIVVLMGYSLWISSQIYDNLTSSNRMMFTTSGQQANIFQETKLKLIAVTEQLQTVTAQLETTKKLYEESQAELQTVTKDLETTKAILAETETLLTQAKASNNELAAKMQTSEAELAQTKASLETKIAQLQEQYNQLTADMEATQKQLHYYEGEFNGMEEGKALLTLYRSKIRLVNTKIVYIKKEAQNARIAAQKEQDKIKLALGNNGYMIKDGSVVKVDMEKYNATVPVVPVSPSERKVSVDVKIVE